MLYIVLALVMTLLDQGIKHLAVLYLKGKTPFVIIEGFFRLRYIENDGMAFSLLKGKQVFLVVMTVAALGFLLYLVKSGTIHGKLGHTAVSFVIGGAVGNLMDRMRLGYVVDMFDWCWFNFPVFNFADLCITAGAILFIIMIFLDYKAEKKGGGHD